MWEFVEATRGVADACHGIPLKTHPDYPTPIIAGNVSFYNESKKGAIPPSPIVSCLGRLKDVNKAIPMSFQKTDSVLLLIGERKDELGGSMYYGLHDELGVNAPKPNLEEVKNQIFALTDCIDNERILSCHDIADGGVASTIAEMAFGNEIGCEAEILGELSNEKILFSETGGFVLEVDPENMNAVKSVYSKYGLNVLEIGKTTLHQSLVINDVINVSARKAKKAWTNGLREKL